VSRKADDHPVSVKLRRSAAPAAAAFGALLAACARDAPQDTLDPSGPIARDASDIFWPVFWIAVAIFFLVEGVLVFALFKFRERRGASDPEQIHGNTRLEIAWTVAPAVLLTFVAVATVISVFEVSRRPSGDVLEVTVTAHQWWWEYEYPDQNVVTANELHIPVGRPVFLTLRSKDVIHSFWVPKLAGKQDVVPGRDNTMTIIASEPGTYLGQCAEYCGLSHANMRLRVIAETSDEFETWARNESSEAEPPNASLAARGERLFLEGACVGCHAVGGTDAQARVGPDLTHFASRTTFAGAIVENTPENLARWLADPPAMKPMPQKEGNTIGMPDYGLSREEIDALVAYLLTLR